MGAIIEKIGSYAGSESLDAEGLKSKLLERDTNHKFYGKDGEPLEGTFEEIIEEKSEITGVRRRVYAPNDLVASDMTVFAVDAANLSERDLSEISDIFIATNFGDIPFGGLPNNDSIVDAVLEKNGFSPQIPITTFHNGCPAYITAMIEANERIEAGDSGKILIISTDTVDRAFDPYKPDIALFGAAAVATLVGPGREGVGIVGSESAVLTSEMAPRLRLDTHELIAYRPSRHPDSDDAYCDMLGFGVYRYVVTQAPRLVDSLAEKLGWSVKELMLFFHQANGRMNTQVAERLKLLEDQVPTIVQFTGNTSNVSTGLLRDMVYKGKVPGYAVKPGDKQIEASGGQNPMKDQPMNLAAFAYIEP